MIDFTPNHQYTEIVDSDVQAEISANKAVQIVIAIAVVASIICLFLGFQNLSWWIMIPITIIMIPVWIVALFFYALASYRPLSKAQVASKLKMLLGLISVMTLHCCKQVVMIMRNISIYSPSHLLNH